MVRNVQGSLFAWMAGMVNVAVEAVRGFVDGSILLLDSVASCDGSIIR
mgnify:FL=1